MTTYETEEDVRRTLRAGGQKLPGERGTVGTESLKLCGKLPKAKGRFRRRSASKLTDSLARPELSARELQVFATYRGR